MFKFTKRKIQKTQRGLSTLNYISSIYEAQQNTSRKVILSGFTIFNSMKNEIIPGFIALPARNATTGFNVFKKNAPKVFFSVDSDIFNALNKNVRCAVAGDAYLAFGLKQNVPTIIIGGREISGETNIEVLVFNEGSLIEVAEHNLPSQDTSQYIDSLNNLVEKLSAQHDNPKIILVAPLVDLSAKIKGSQYADEHIFNSLTYRKIDVKGKLITSLAIPAGIVLAGTIFYITAILMGWNLYTKAINEYKEAVKDQLVIKQNGIDTQVLDVMDQQRIFMQAPKRQVKLSEQLKQIVIGIGKVSGVFILEIKMPAVIDTAKENIELNNSKEPIPDVLISLSVPKEDRSAMEQAKELINLISQNTGLSIHLARQGWHDEGLKRLFNIEGFIHD